MSRSLSLYIYIYLRYVYMHLRVLQLHLSSTGKSDMSFGPTVPEWFIHLESLRHLSQLNAEPLSGRHAGADCRVEGDFIRLKSPAAPKGGNLEP